MSKQTTIHATPLSLGGAVVLGLLILVGALAWIAFQPQEPSTALRIVLALVWFGLLAYAIDAWSETLRYEDGRIVFNSLFKRRVEILMRKTDDILVVHEGLNQEQGIISARFRERDGSIIDLPLGPFWLRHELESFFGTVERIAGNVHLVESVR
jgi:predicted membrane metal-binding protein